MKLSILLVMLTLGAVQAAGTDTLRIYAVDVEGGGATLVISPGGQSMLIDSGSPGAAAERDSKRIADAMHAAGRTQRDDVMRREARQVRARVGGRRGRVGK